MTDIGIRALDPVQRDLAARAETGRKLRAMLRHLWDRWREARRLHRDRVVLLTFDDEQLRDAGLTRADLDIDRWCQPRG